MDPNKYATLIIAAFEQVDAVLERLPVHSLRYKILFALRTDYAVRDEIIHHKGEHTILYKFKALLKFLAWLVLFPWIGIRTESQQASVILLGQWRFDDSLSQQLNIPILHTKRFYRFICFSDIIWGCRTLWAWLCLFGAKELSAAKLLWCAPQAICFGKYYSSIDLQSVRVIITEDDITPNHVAILMRAKELGIKRVKIEYVQIDSLVHNNVYCDYYFYPTTYHRKIREASSWNKDLVYVEGGYLNVDYVRYAKLKNTEGQCNQVVFYTSHSNCFIHDDTFYIDQIINRLPEGYTLVIKIHPYDSSVKYDRYRINPRVKVFTFDQIDNATLIAQAKFCFSQFSVMSFEAKFVCENSYFLNYAWRESQFAVDYQYINGFFDTVDTPAMLDIVLKDVYTPVSIEKFRQNVNMTYPHTFDVFKRFISELY